MKKLLYIILALFGLMLFSTVGAVEIKKDTTDSRPIQQIENKPSSGGQDSAAKPKPNVEAKTKPEQPKTATKDFDSFVDKNNNGIDDRAEKKNPAEASEQKPKK